MLQILKKYCVCHSVCVLPTCLFAISEIMVRGSSFGIREYWVCMWTQSLCSYVTPNKSFKFLYYDFLLHKLGMIPFAFQGC